MSTFDDRERAYESKFAHDAEMAFKAEARRNKLLGQWAADLLGKTGAAAEAYVGSVLAADFKEAGDNDVHAKVSADLDGKATPAEVRAKMDALMLVAKDQLVNEG